MDYSILNVIVPIYNKLGGSHSFRLELITNYQSNYYLIIFSNDGSFSKSSDLLVSLPASENIHINSHKVNQGYERTLKIRSGFAEPVLFSRWMAIVSIAQTTLHPWSFWPNKKSLTRLLAGESRANKTSLFAPLESNSIVGWL